VAANCFLKTAPLRPQSKVPLLTSLLNKQSHSCEKEPLAFTPRYPISILTVWISAKKRQFSSTLCGGEIVLAKRQKVLTSSDYFPPACQ